MVNVLGTPEAQAQFYVLGKVWPWRYNSLTNFNDYTQVNTDLKRLLYGDYEGNFKIEGTTFVLQVLSPGGGS